MVKKTIQATMFSVKKKTFSKRFFFSDLLILGSCGRTKSENRQKFPLHPLLWTIQTAGGGNKKKEGQNPISTDKFSTMTLYPSNKKENTATQT